MQTIIDNCDTFITMGGNDFSTAEMIARRADRPLTDIQNMSVSTKWVFQRRWKPVFSSTADLDGYDLPRQIEASFMRRSRNRIGLPLNCGIAYCRQFRKQTGQELRSAPALFFISDIPF